MPEVAPRDDAAGGPGDPSSRPARSAAAADDAADLIAAAGLAARRFDVPAAAAVFEPDAPARNLYLLHGGQVRVLLLTPGAGERAVRLLEILGPGDWFGAPALSVAAVVGAAAAPPGGPAFAPPAPAAYGTRAVAVTTATVSEVPADRLFAALPAHPAIAAALIRSLGSKLQAAYGEAATLVFDDTNRRLVRTLLQFSRSAAATPQPGPEGQAGVELRITHQQLAQAIGAARETVSLALTQLRQRNLLRTGRNRLSFSPGALEDFYRAQAGPREAKEAAE